MQAKALPLRKRRLPNLADGRSVMTAIPVEVQTRYTGKQIHTIFCGLVLIMLLGTIDQAIVAPALAPIATEFGGFGSVSWVVTAYLLTSTASTPVAGRLSDIHGRRSIVIAALVLFLVGSIVCGWAPNLNTLIIGRGIQGLGGGALMALPNTIVADILSPRERGRYQAYISCTYAVSSLAGPVLGGLLSGHYSWRWIFWINLPVIALAAGLSWITLGELSAKRKQHKIDYLGSALMVSSTVCLLLALTWGGRRFAWDGLPIVALFSGTVLFATLFVAWQKRAPEPLLPLSILHNRIIVITSIGAVLITMVNMALSIYLPLYFQIGRGQTVGDAGSMLTAPLFGVVLGSYLSGQYMRYSGKYKLPPLAGLAVAVPMLAILAYGIADLPIIAIVALTFLQGIGIGASLPPMMVSSQNSVPASDIGIATAVHTFFRAVGGTVGVAVFSALILHLLGTDAKLLDGPRSDLHADAALAVATIPFTHAFGVFFAACATTLALAWLALNILPVIPFRETAARLEGNETRGISAQSDIG
jgi:EmrB/QacA subfamily drug resistance transporter